ncbi:hypothetical protein I4U23_005941 [Adineta vaga]|nr:hypothetical protein I4U23_005941 [Adineta vaga]
MATSYTPNLANSRYTDFRDEPVSRLLAPISGYQDMPQVSLEESVEPVAELFDEINSCIWVSKENCKNPADGNPPIKKINDNTNAKPTPPPVPQKVVPPPAPKIVPPSPPATQKKAKYCGGNACSKCGLCIDWSYDGDLARDYDLWINDKSDDVRDGNRWHRSPHATCDRYADHADHDYDYYRYHAAHHAHHALCKCPR